MEFAYNNSYQLSIEMAPYEALYGRKCRTPLCWDEVGEGKLLGPEIVQVLTDDVKVIKDRLKKAQDRQKIYADNRMRDLEFQNEYFSFHGQISSLLHTENHLHPILSLIVCFVPLKYLTACWFLVYDN